MGRVLPRSQSGRLGFFESHIQQWIEHQEALGITPESLDRLRDAIDAAREDYNQSEVAQFIARAATAQRDASIDDLVKLGSALIAGMKARAQQTKDDSIYTAAGIPRPATTRRKPIAPPTPEAVTAQINNLGGVDLQWRSPGGNVWNGVAFSIHRSVKGSAFEVIGMTGERRFTDHTITAADFTAGPVQYMVSTVRNRFESDPSQPIAVFAGSLLAAGDVTRSPCAA